MYTVIRFIAGPLSSDVILEEIGSRLNLLAEGSFKRLDRAGNRFSVSISSDNSWDAHSESIAAFVRKMAAVIFEAQAKDVAVVVDVAVEPEDIEGKPYFSCEISAPLLQELADYKVGICFTFYGRSLTFPPWQI